MKCASSAVALVALAAGHATAARLHDTPMAKVVKLLQDMEKKIDETGKSEQTSYDKYACWCEDTLAEKADAITKAKDKLEELQNNINKNKGGLGSGGATIAQLNKDIAENIASQKEATAVREKETTEYSEERTEAEQCIGALEAAIKVLTGAGTGKKKGFLETLQEAQVLSIVAGMRQVVQARVVKQTMKQKDLDVVRHFVEKPEDFVKGQGAFAQVQQNPFGDYAPQSTQIQGILKSMYDSFTSDLEKDNVEEAEKQKSFEELMATKKKELNTLQDSLEDETKTAAERTKELADDKAMRDETREQLDSDETFFVSTKGACSKKATHWAQRSRLRTMELAGIKEAIKILNSDEAKKTFGESQAAFVQTSAVVHHPGNSKARMKAYNRLRSLAASEHNLQLAQIAIAVKTRGHFDDVIAMIDKMIAALRVEEQEDIEHRDRCEGKQNANKNSAEDAEHVIKKAKDEIERLEDAIKDKKADIKEIEKSMKENKKTQDEITKQRNKETEAFKKAQKADEDAIEVLGKAQRALEKFYRETKAASLLQVAPAKAAATVASSKEAKQAKEVKAAPAAKDVKPAPAKPAAAAPKAPAEKAAKPVAAEPVAATPKAPAAPQEVKLVAAKPQPETNWQGGDYKGSTGEARGVLGIIEMLKEDIKNEMNSQAQDEIDAQVAYEEDSTALTRSYRAMEKEKTKAESEVADFQSDKQDQEDTKDAAQKDLDNEKKLKKAIEKDCNWVKSHFDKRREARKAEIAGLQDAKDFLAGAGTDSDLDMP